MAITVCSNTASGYHVFSWNGKGDRVCPKCIRLGIKPLKEKKCRKKDKKSRT